MYRPVLYLLVLCVTVYGNKRVYSFSLNEITSMITQYSKWLIFQRKLLTESLYSFCFWFLFIGQLEQSWNTWMSQPQQTSISPWGTLKIEYNFQVTKHFYPRLFQPECFIPKIRNFKVINLNCFNLSLFIYYMSQEVSVSTIGF